VKEFDLRSDWESNAERKQRSVCVTNPGRTSACRLKLTVLEINRLHSGNGQTYACTLLNPKLKKNRLSLERSQEQQNHYDQHQQTKAAAWSVAPIPAVGPRRDSTQQQND
jgi:hypothetical protein